MKRIRRNRDGLGVPPFLPGVAKLPQCETPAREACATPAGSAIPPFNSRTALGNGTAIMSLKPLLFVAVMLGLVSAAYAQGGDPAPQAKQNHARPELFEALVRCRAISGDA